MGLAVAAVALLSGVAPGQSASPDSAIYTLSPATRLDVHTGRAGLLGGMAHDHLVRARAFRGSIVYVPGDPARSSVSITVSTDSLAILTDAKPKDLAKMTRAMREQTLKVAEFAEITFVSREVTPIAGGLRVAGDFTLVGQTRRITADVTVFVDGDTLRAATRFRLKQTDFGIKPYGTALGTVRVKDEVAFELEVVGVRLQ